MKTKPITMHAAAAVVATIGINTHLGYVQTYADSVAVLQSLQYLGVSHVRDYAPQSSDPKSARWRYLASNGVRFSFVLDQGVDIRDFLVRSRSFNNRFPGRLASLEGPNEIWNWPVTYGKLTGMSAGAAVQHALFKAIKNDDGLRAVPVLALTTGGGHPSETYAKLGKLSSAADLGNVHIYPQGDDPSPFNYLVDNIPWQTSVTTPNLPVVITEAGYYTMPDGAYGVSPRVQAVYTLNMLLDAYLLGVKATYLYELFDEKVDPKNTNREYHFGLFTTNKRPKPAAVALHNLTSILGDARKTENSSLMHKIEGLPEYGHSLDLVKENGRELLVVWVEPIIWNKRTRLETKASNLRLRIMFDPLREVELFDPLIGPGPVRTFKGSSIIEVEVTDHPLILESGLRPK